MANEVVQAGTAILVGAQGMSWTGYLITDATWRTRYSGSSDSKDYNGNVRGKQRAGKYVEMTLTAEVDDPAETSTEVWELEPGSTGTIKFPSDQGGAGASVTGEWQDDVEVKLLDGDTAKLLISGTFRKEDTMSYA